MNYLPFKTRGGPRLQTALVNLPNPYRNGYAGDTFCYYRFDIQDLRLQKEDCNEIEVSPEEFVSKVNSFISASKFACKGSPELAQLLDTYHEAGLKDFQNDPCISSDKCYFIWENQLFSRPYSEIVPIERFRAYWDSKFGISLVSTSHKSLLDKTKVFVRGGEETGNILHDLSNRGIIKFNSNHSMFFNDNCYFAQGFGKSIGTICWNDDSKLYIHKGYTEVTPQQFKALWDSTIEKKPTMTDKNKTFVRGGEETKEVLIALLRLGLFETVLNPNDFSDKDHYFALGSIRKGRLTWTANRDYYLKQGLTEITPFEVEALWLQEEWTPLKVSSAHINIESPKNSKPFGLSKKQTLKIVL